MKAWSFPSILRFTFQGLSCKSTHVFYYILRSEEKSARNPPSLAERWLNSLRVVSLIEAHPVEGFCRCCLHTRSIRKPRKASWERAEKRKRKFWKLPRQPIWIRLWLNHFCLSSVNPKMSILFDRMSRIVNRRRTKTTIIMMVRKMKTMVPAGVDRIEFSRKDNDLKGAKKVEKESETTFLTEKIDFSDGKNFEGFWKGCFGVACVRHKLRQQVRQVVLTVNPVVMVTGSKKEKRKNSETHKFTRSLGGLFIQKSNSVKNLFITEKVTRLLLLMLLLQEREREESWLFRMLFPFKGTKCRLLKTIYYLRVKRRKDSSTSHTSVICKEFFHFFRKREWKVGKRDVGQCQSLGGKEPEELKLFFPELREIAQKKLLDNKDGEHINETNDDSVYWVEDQT